MSRPSLDDGGVSATSHKEQRAGSSSENTLASHPPIPIRIPPWCAGALASCRMVKVVKVELLHCQPTPGPSPIHPRSQIGFQMVNHQSRPGRTRLLLLGYEGQADTFSRSRHSLDAPSLPKETSATIFISYMWDCKSHAD